jgi:CBS domain-containing protein
MRVGSICRRDVLWVDEGESLADAASKLQFYEVGSLVVYRERRMVGIITERDLVRAIAEGARPARTPVSRYMTETPMVVPSDTEADEAVRLMLEMGVRHLPVVDGDRLVGMVSARDLLAEEHALIVSATDLQLDT